MVRESTTKHGCYALSLRVPRDFQVSGIAHYLILKTAKGYKIKVRLLEFIDGEQLIVCFAVALPSAAAYHRTYCVGSQGHDILVVIHLKNNRHRSASSKQ